MFFLIKFLPLLPADGSGMVANKNRPMGTTTDLENKSRHNLVRDTRFFSLVSLFFWLEKKEGSKLWSIELRTGLIDAYIRVKKAFHVVSREKLGYITDAWLAWLAMFVF